MKTNYNHRVTTVTIAALLAATCLGVQAVSIAAVEPGDAPPQDGSAKYMIGNIEYKKLATRQESEERVMRLIFPDQPAWGPWSMLVGFEYESKPGKNLAAVLPPEAELTKMSAGGPGPDLSKEYTGKQSRKLAWSPLGDIRNRAVSMAIYKENADNLNAVGYLYCEVKAEKATTVNVTMGSDDGLRLWVNGRLVVDADVARGLDPFSHRVKLDLQPGVNHVLAKVSQGAGAFEFQINAKPDLEPAMDAALQYYLNSDFPRSAEDKYYRAITLPASADAVLEVGGLAVLPAGIDGKPESKFGRPMVSTRRGDVWIIENAYENPPFGVKYKKFATGLHEPLGLAAKIENGKTVAYCVQRSELTRMVDNDGDDVADEYSTVSNFWSVSGNYHEFAFGPKFDRDGNAWVTLNVGFCGALGKAIVPYRGWSLKVAPDGTVTPWSDGLRSPNGIGQWTDGTMFYLDNQGDYVGANRLSPMLKGNFAGHPASLRWREGWSEGQTPPEVQPATVWFPYRKMGQSVADFLLYPATEDGNGPFGPFAGQVFCGDQTMCMVNRVSIEKIDGVYQGACYPFREGLQCGVNRLAWGTDGSMFVGQTDRGWGSTGRARYGVERLVWNGEVPFELREMRIKPDGFELEFTKDVDKAAASDPASYAMSSYTYEYHQTYGSDEIDTKKVEIKAVEFVSPRVVRIKTSQIRSGGMGYVHELTMPGVKSAATAAENGEELVHRVAYYTVQRVPK